nr:MAG TPA: hypothetical protein [Bacteriophage sp.]
MIYIVDFGTCYKIVQTLEKEYKHSKILEKM